MGLTVTEDAAKWYKYEMDLAPGEYIRFFVKLYGGIPTAHSSYFLGISVGKDGEVGQSVRVNGLTFYFSQQDAWFLDEFHVLVTMGEEDVIYNFTPVE